MPKETLDVLIVDDSAVIRNVLRRILRKLPLPIGEIQEAEDGTRAVEILTLRSFDLILSDLDMPRMDGLQLIAWIRGAEHLKNIPVIVITTEGAEGRVREAVQLGATGYVRKPFTAEQINDALTGLF